MRCSALFKGRRVTSYKFLATRAISRMVTAGDTTVLTKKNTVLTKENTVAAKINSVLTSDVKSSIVEE